MKVNIKDFFMIVLLCFVFIISMFLVLKPTNMFLMASGKGVQQEPKGSGNTPPSECVYPPDSCEVCDPETGICSTIADCCAGSTCNRTVWWTNPEDGIEYIIGRKCDYTTTETPTPSPSACVYPPESCEICDPHTSDCWTVADCCSGSECNTTVWWTDPEDGIAKSIGKSCGW